MVFTEGQSTQCIIVGGDAQSCIADASYVCRSGEWRVEGGLPVQQQWDTYQINQLQQIPSAQSVINSLQNGASFQDTLNAFLQGFK